ncbi:MAG: vitamin B12 dependent-methionine synthase activation domain-containing protein [Armatimonadota bacterium]
MQTVAQIPVELDLERIHSDLHVSPESEDAKDLADLVERVAAMAEPKAAYDVCYVDDRGAGGVIINGVTFTSRVLEVNLRKVHRVFPFVVTCGRELENVPGVDGDPLREYWLDHLRILALQAASARLKAHIESTYQPGKLSSMSPGSLADWPITQQKQLFALLGDVEGAIGVELTDSYLMVPMKSVSGMYFPTEASFHSCSLCPRKECPGRSAPYDERLWAEKYAERRTG